VGTRVPAHRPAERLPAPGRAASRQPAPPVSPMSPGSPLPETSVDDDVEQLSMSTLSFQDYVRERMLKRRDQELKAQAPKAPPRVWTSCARCAA
jgi:flagellar biosynthesis protein FlhF